MNFNEKTSGAMYFFDNRGGKRAYLRIFIQQDAGTTLRCTSAGTFNVFSRVEAALAECTKISFEATNSDDENEL